MLLALTAAVWAQQAQLVELPLRPANVWVGGRPAAAKTALISNGRYRITAGSKRLDLYVRDAQDEWTLIVRPRQEVTLSFRLEGHALASRLTRPESGRVFQSALGHPVSYLNDGLYLPERQVAYRFTGAPSALYGGETSGAVKVAFTKFSDRLTVKRLGPGAIHPDAAGGVLKAYEPFGASNALPAELQVWVSLNAASGRSLGRGIGSGPAEIREVLRRGSPAFSVRPMDLYLPLEIPRIWVTHVNEGGAEYSVVAVVNPGDQPRTLRFAFGELGVNPDLSYSVFDFWRIQNLGVFAGTAAMTLQPGSGRLLFVRRAQEKPHLLGSSSHALGDVAAAAHAEWDGASRQLRGKAILPKDEPLILYISSSAPGKRFIKPAAWVSKGRAKIHENRGFWRLELHEPEGGSVDWTVTFGGTEAVVSPNAPKVTAGAGSPFSAILSRKPDRVTGTAGHYVFRNDMLIGYFADDEMIDDTVEPGSFYSYSVVAVDFAGQVSNPAVYAVRTPWPADGSLTALAAFSTSQQEGKLRRNRSFSGGPMKVKGKSYAGIGTHARSEIVYRLFRAYATFEGSVALDDGSRGRGSVVFRILGDGEELWTSGLIKPGEVVEFSVDVADVSSLTLLVEDGADGNEGDHADWLNPTLKAKPHP